MGRAVLLRTSAHRIILTRAPGRNQGEAVGRAAG